MTIAAQILHQLTRLGVVAMATPDGFLDLEPAENLTPELLETIRAHKPEILEHLATSTEPALTVWSLLRADWKLFIEHGIAEDDTIGSITATAETGGMVLPVNLKDVGNLTSAIKRLIEKYPDPLEVRISAQHDDSLFLRARYTRRMAKPFENCEPVQA